MTTWRAVSAIASFVLGSTRELLAWTEERVPWPATLVPRTLRLPIDALEAIGVEVLDRPARAGRDGARDHDGDPTSALRRAPAYEHRTASIGGTRRQGSNDDAPRFDRQGPNVAPRFDRQGPNVAPRFDRDVRSRLAPLHCRDVGRGPAVVLLHAFPLGSRMWEPQIEELSSRYRVLAPDLAGFGLSWTPAASLSLDGQADAVEATLHDLGVADVVVVGLSMGGYVALPLVERLGARVHGLVLADTRASADDDATAADRHRLAAEVLASGVEVAAAESLTRALGRSTLRDRPDLVDRVRAIVLENKPEGLAAALRAMAARADASWRLPRLSCPVLLISGEEDELTGPQTANAMAAGIPYGRVEVVPRAGHLSNLEAPDEFNRLLAGFAHQVTRQEGRRAAAAGRP